MLRAVPDGGAAALADVAREAQPVSGITVACPWWLPHVHVYCANKETKKGNEDNSVMS